MREELRHKLIAAIKSRTRVGNILEDYETIDPGLLTPSEFETLIDVIMEVINDEDPTRYQ